MSELPEELLSAYLDGECATEERAAVEARLARDDDWRAVLTDLQVARNALRALPWREPPRGFFDSVIGRRPARRSRVAVPLAAAAAVVAVALAVPTNRGTKVLPSVATLSHTHGATAAQASDPVSNLAPVAVPVRLRP